MGDMILDEQGRAFSTTKQDKFVLSVNRKQQQQQSVNKNQQQEQQQLQQQQQQQQEENNIQMSSVSQMDEEMSVGFQLSSSVSSLSIWSSSNKMEYMIEEQKQQPLMEFDA